MVAGGDVGLGIFGNSGNITCAVVTRPPVCRCVMLYAFMHSHMHVCQQTQFTRRACRWIVIAVAKATLSLVFAKFYRLGILCAVLYFFLFFFNPLFVCV